MTAPRNVRLLVSVPPVIARMDRAAMNAPRKALLLAPGTGRRYSCSVGASSAMFKAGGAESAAEKGMSESGTGHSFPFPTTPNKWRAN